MVTKRLSENNKTVTAHLGSGCSMLASFGEKAITTTMGFSALDGIVMGTRSGRIDPGVILYMLQNKKWDYKTIEKVLYKESGWKGISNFSGDMKVLLNNIDKPKVKDSIDYFVKEIVFNITGFMSHLKGLDNIVFTGGVGENSPYLRKLILSELEWLGVDIDNNINENIKEGLISSKNSKIKVFVIPTNEELILAKHALKH